jgi:hypothetical protein
MDFFLPLTLHMNLMQAYSRRRAIPPFAITYYPTFRVGIIKIDTEPLPPLTLHMNFTQAYSRRRAIPPFAITYYPTFRVGIVKIDTKPLPPFDSAYESHAGLFRKTSHSPFCHHVLPLL